MAMVYDITSKLKFNEDPVIKVKDVEIRVCSDADVVLQILDLMQHKSEMEAAVEATRLLFPETEREKLRKLNIKISDYMEILTTAIDMAMGNDPDAGAEGKN